MEIEAYAVIDATGRTASASSSPLARIFGEPVRSTHAELVRRAGSPPVRPASWTSELKDGFVITRHATTRSV